MAAYRPKSRCCVYVLSIDAIVGLLGHTFGFLFIGTLFPFLVITSTLRGIEVELAISVYRELKCELSGAVENNACLIFLTLY